MSNELQPSVFTVPINATKEEIWLKIFHTLSDEMQQVIDYGKSELVQPFPGGNEFLVRDKNGNLVIIAVLSEIGNDTQDWSLYYEA